MTTGYFEAIPLDEMTASQTQLSKEERIQEIADRLQEVSQTRIKCVLSVQCPKNWKSIFSIN